MNTAKEKGKRRGGEGEERGRGKETGREWVRRGEERGREEGRGGQGEGKAEEHNSTGRHSKTRSRNTQCRQTQSSITSSLNDEFSPGIFPKPHHIFSLLWPPLVTSHSELHLIVPPTASDLDQSAPIPRLKGHPERPQPVSHIPHC